MTDPSEAQENRRERIEYLGGPTKTANSLGMNERVVQRIYSGRTYASATFDRRLWDAVLAEQVRRQQIDAADAR